VRNPVMTLAGHIVSRELFAVFEYVETCAPAAVGVEGWAVAP
jgi:hypothetical protein